MYWQNENINVQKTEKINIRVCLQKSNLDLQKVFNTQTKTTLKRVSRKRRMKVEV